MADINTNRDDVLLQQIDAFREKAMQLQTLISAKEERVSELENTVKEREAQIQELQATLAKKQEEADGIVADVNVQVDRMMQSIRDNMDALESKIGAQVENNEEANAEATKAMQETLSGMNEALESIKSELADKVHNENVKVYRNIQDLLKELDHSEEEKTEMEHRLSSIKSTNTAGLVFTLINILLSGAVGVVVLFAMGIF